MIIRFIENNKFLKKLGKRNMHALTIPFYQMTWSKEAAYTFFLIQKTGISSMLRVLRDETEIDFDEKTAIYFKSQHQNHFKFCFIRNPWDRLVSCYSNKVLRKKLYPECWGKDFSYFIHFLTRQHLPTADGHIRLQTSSFPVNDIDFIGRFENFSDDFDFIINDKLKLNRNPVKKNQSRHAHYTQYYSNKTRRMVEKLYKEDIKLGNYRFGV
ncbi:MAG: sulfotransferase family 2 domain-containing protein [Bacteroidales bacterium]